MSFQKILCPIDFSPGARQAMRVAIRLANEAGAELVLVHAWYVPPVAFAGEYMFSPELMQAIYDESGGALQVAVRDATTLGAKRLTSQLLAGMPKHEIPRLLEQDPAFDLVVMGTHGRTGLPRVLLGSVAEYIVRHAPCSVLVVRPDSEVAPFHRVLCPTDFSDSSWHAAELAAGLAPAGSAGTTLLHVIDPPIVHDRAQSTLEFLRDLDRRSNEHLARWAAQLQAKTAAPVRQLCRVGRPGEEILKALDEDPAFDLVVTGSHGRTGIARVFLGSVAEKVVRHAQRPVLVARRRGQPAI
ncbi:MAG TPA: universal stress protein [Kofleriaceae bacterium]|nr:universal stress protein [Kofleriaceae bacterium]